MSYCFLFFFFNDTATTEIYTLSLHDALPIWGLLFGGTMLRNVTWAIVWSNPHRPRPPDKPEELLRITRDRKSTRLNSSHANISYAVFCLKKKIKHQSHLCIYRYNLTDNSHVR